MFLRSVIFLLGVLLSVHGMAQTGHELIDVASFFNGGFPYSPTSSKAAGVDTRFNQLETISHGHTINAFYRDDLHSKVNFDANLFYSFATSATIETFRVTGDDKSRDLMPRKIEFALSQSPAGPFQTVAAFDVPESYLVASRVHYDFSIPVKQKISGRYVRITLSGSKYGRYRLSSFSAYGRFDQPVKLREDFNGSYYIQGGKPDSPANADMVNQQGKTAYHPYLILHQKNGQINGCYIYGDSGKSRFEKINAISGTLTGGVENNVFRFTRTHKDGSQSQGAMVLAPIAEGIRKNDYNWTGYLLIMDDVRAGSKEGSGAFRVDLIRLFYAPDPCAVTGQKEKTASEAMKETIEKTGKVQLYGVNFDFDSDTLRPESGAVLDEVVTLAKANPAWKFEIGGHTDSVGSADYNLKLSDRRAASVVRYLTGKGIDAARLQAKGYGATRPIVPETDGNDVARAQNRRVELVKQ